MKFEKDDSSVLDWTVLDEQADRLIGALFTPATRAYTPAMDGASAGPSRRTRRSRDPRVAWRATRRTARRAHRPQARRIRTRGRGAGGVARQLAERERQEREAGR
jgi:hypothetical protein